MEVGRRLVGFPTRTLRLNSDCLPEHDSGPGLALGRLQKKTGWQPNSDGECQHTEQIGGNQKKLSATTSGTRQWVFPVARQLVSMW